jgi:hypothetical protein
MPQWYSVVWSHSLKGSKFNGQILNQSKLCKDKLEDQILTLNY